MSIGHRYTHIQLILTYNIYLVRQNKVFSWSRENKVIATTK